ncbi:MAG: type IVB secretion system protein IcmH/DotU [Rubrivivax sp.]
MGALSAVAAAASPTPSGATARATPAPLPDRQRLALHAAARPLIALTMPLRQARAAAPAAIRPALAAALARFERELADAGWHGRGVAAASYLMCTWIDEVVADTPWGAGGAGLLERFHGEREGGERVLRLLSTLAERPDENRALLELFHVCLGLGLSGNLRRQPDAARQRDSLRRRVFRALGAGATTPPPLSPAWQSAAPAREPGWRRHAALAALLALALAAVGVYSVSRLRLAAQVDDVFTTMQRLAPAATVPPAPLSVVPPRLAPLLLGADTALQVRDEAHRSVVALPAQALFTSATGRLTAAGDAQLAHIATVLSSLPGKVVVVGHTDGGDPRSAALPSAWHQSYAWAREVANALTRTLPAERIVVEGAAEIDDDATAPGLPAPPRRRVDIVLYP